MSTRAIGVLGLVGFGLVVVATVIEPLWLAPGTSSSGAEIAAYVARNRDGFTGSVFFYGLGMGVFLAFSAALWGWLRTQPGVAEPLAAIFGFGAASLCTVVLAGFAVMLAFAYRPSVAVPRELYDVTFGLLAVSGIPTALALGAYAAIVLGARPLPAWTAWVALVGAAAHVLVAASFFIHSGFFSLEGGVIVAIPATMFIWLVATSVSLLGVGNQPSTRTNGGSA